MGDTLCSWVRRFNIVKNDNSPQIDYRCNATSIQILAGVFKVGNEKNSHGNAKGSRETKISLKRSEKKDEVGGLTLPDVKTHCKVTGSGQWNVGIKTDK